MVDGQSHIHTSLSLSSTFLLHIVFVVVFAPYLLLVTLCAGDVKYGCRQRYFMKNDYNTIRLLNLVLNGQCAQTFAGRNIQRVNVEVKMDGRKRPYNKYEEWMVLVVILLILLLYYKTLLIVSNKICGKITSQK